MNWKQIIVLIIMIPIIIECLRIMYWVKKALKEDRQEKKDGKHTKSISYIQNDMELRN